MEHDAERAQEIRLRKFEFHNSKWLNSVHDAGGAREEPYEDYVHEACG